MEKFRDPGHGAVSMTNTAHFSYRNPLITRQVYYRLLFIHFVYYKTDRSRQTQELFSENKSHRILQNINHYCPAEESPETPNNAGVGQGRAVPPFDCVGSQPPPYLLPWSLLI